MRYFIHSLLLLICLYLAVPRVSAQDTSLEELQQISAAVQKIVTHIRERTVTIKIKVGEHTGFGSGAIISEDGLILTCAHVSEVSNELTVVTADDKEYPAKKLGMNSLNDYSLIRIEEKGLPFFEFGDSAKLQVLDWVIAAGHPGGPYPDYEPAIALGRVRGLHKKLPIQLGAKFYDDAIQTDIPIFAGNSGGPLISLEGKLLGLNGAITLVSDLAFAVPIHEILNDLTQLKKGEDATGREMGNMWEVFADLQEDMPMEDLYRTFKDSPLGKFFQWWSGDDSVIMPAMPKPELGMAFQQLAQGKIVVASVKSNSLGQMAGFRVGDEIVSLDEQKLTTLADFEDALEDAEKGASNTVQIVRNGKTTNILLIWDKAGYSRMRVLKRSLVHHGLNLMPFTVKIRNKTELLGYGVIIAPEGWVLTNYEVIRKYPNIQIQLQDSNGSIWPAEIVGRNGLLDVALLRFKPTKPIKAIAIGDDKKLKIGQWVISGGCEDGIVQAGIVSALGRQVPPNRKVPTLGIFSFLGRPNKSPVRAFQEVIHHDSNIEEDEFGTPLVNEQGELVGINAGHFYRGTTFAIPISVILPILSDLKAGVQVATPPEYQPYEPELDPFAKFFQYLLKPHNRNTDPLGKILRDMLEQVGGKKEGKKDKEGETTKGGAFLGIRVQEHADGVEVVEVLKGHAADKAGMLKGDIIIEMGKQKITSSVQLIERLQNLSAGLEIDITVLRTQDNQKVPKHLLIVLERHP